MSFAGKTLQIKYYPEGFSTPGSAELLMGVKAESGSFTSEPFDISDKGSQPWRELGNDVAVKSVDLTASGILKGPQLVDLYNGQGEGSSLHDFGLFVRDMGEWQGPFFIASLNPAGEDGSGNRTYEITLNSAGVVTWVPAS